MYPSKRNFQVSLKCKIKKIRQFSSKDSAVTHTYVPNWQACKILMTSEMQMAVIQQSEVTFPQSLVKQVWQMLHGENEKASSQKRGYSFCKHSF